MASGVYEIVNKINKKRYIGSSIDLVGRRIKHFSGLRKNAHGNKYLQHSFNKYGEENFIFNILFECDKCVILYYEQQWINSMDIKNLYNIVPIAGNIMGYKHSLEVKIKLSQINKGRKMFEADKIKMRGRKCSADTKQKMKDAWLSRSRIISDKTMEKKRNSSKCKPVFMIDAKSGIILSTYRSANEAKRTTGVLSENIYACCSGKYKTSGGFIWRYANKNLQIGDQYEKE